jgi:hypothetical protein
MQINYVSCPHCRNQLINDGQYAGQTVQCPACQGQFQMTSVEQMSPIVGIDPSPLATINLSSSNYQTSIRRHTPRKNSTTLVVSGVLGLLAIIGAGVAFSIMQRPDKTLSAQKDRSSDVAVERPENKPIKQSKKAPGPREASNDFALKDPKREANSTAATSQSQEDERRQQNNWPMQEGLRTNKENEKLRIDEEVRRQLEEKRQQRETRLAALAQREKNEIPPIENEIKEIQDKIVAGDKNMAQLREQMAKLSALPKSVGVPPGTKFQPPISRETRDEILKIEQEGIQRWKKTQDDYEQNRSKLVEQVRDAEQRLKAKQSEFDRERQRINSEF